MNAALRPRRMTREQFFDWAQQQDARHEFDGSRPVPMTGGSPDHSLIAGAILSMLRVQLKGSGWKVLGPDAGVATVGDVVRYPDVLVTRSAFDGEGRLVPGAVVVFEVLSKTSEQTDRVEKVAEYRAVPSILRHVVVERIRIGATVFERAAGDRPWTQSTLAAGQTLRLPEIGIDVLLDDFYEDVDLPGPASPSA